MHTTAPMQRLASGPRKALSSIPRPVKTQASPAPKTATVVSQKIVVKDYGSCTLQGTSRKINEDRFDVKVAEGVSAAGEPYVFAGVYDGHGGTAVADWLKNKLFGVIQENWTDGYKPKNAIFDAYLAADKKLLSVGAGFMGLGERGVGGSKCGATAANVLVYQDNDGSSKLLTANVGDARVVLIRGGKPEQLTVDHVPDSEEERYRIETFNPNPRLPLVRYVGGTWRVGGLLALSRAFGDAYLKGSLQFEGLAMADDARYSSGFGLTAEPHTSLESLSDEDSYLIVATDGLFAEVERGGGGGLDNELLAELCTAAGGAKCSELAATLADTAVKLGSTDDVTVVVFRLGSA